MYTHPEDIAYETHSDRQAQTTEEWNEERINIIGQNGNDGIHYQSYQDKVNSFITPTSTKLVVEDLTRREMFGYEKYGKFLSKYTDEDMLQHLYEELLDASVYIRTLIEQRKKT